MTDIQRKIILFNGPPRSGKDTIANETAARFNKLAPHICKFAAPLKSTATHMYCGGDSGIFHQLDSSEMKDQPHYRFFGKTCREVQIAISETYFKPLHGPKVFGKILSQYITTAIEKEQKPLNLFFVTDSGFRPEAEEVVQQHGAENVLLIRVHREGYTFDGDSRSYINLNDLGVESVDLYNDDLGATVNVTQRIIDAFIKGEANDLTVASYNA